MSVEVFVVLCITYLVGRTEYASIFRQLKLQIPLDNMIPAVSPYCCVEGSLEVASENIDNKTDFANHVEIWRLIRVVPKATGQSSPRRSSDGTYKMSISTATFSWTACLSASAALNSPATAGIVFKFLNGVRRCMTACRLVLPQAMGLRTYGESL